mgnify:CR=1 FL=1
MDAAGFVVQQVVTFAVAALAVIVVLVAVLSWWLRN